MATINPFYRFEPAWNAGFYPNNSIVSNLLDDVYDGITAGIPSWGVIGVNTLQELYNSIHQYLDPYNSYPYYGDFEITIETIAAGPIFNFTITIRNNALYVVDNTQEVVVTGTASNPGYLLSSVSIGVFSAGSYSGDFDNAIIAEELKVKHALQIVQNIGSAIIPTTYAYDTATKTAISGLARGSDWRLYSNEVNRFPLPVKAFRAARTFNLPSFNADDTYIISLIERIIQVSLNDDNYTTAILPFYNSLVIPTGWSSTIDHPTFSTYERVQINFVNSARRKFILVGRKGGTNWLWQRFVSDEYANPAYDFLTNYPESLSLPYTPLSSSSWLYNNDTFDYDFVEFNDGCVYQKEFYQMPAKPGDQFQFNVLDANLTGVQDVNIGLFEQDGTFIQKIGEAIKLPDLTCEDASVTCDHEFAYTVTSANVAGYLEDINEQKVETLGFIVCFLGFYIYNSDNQILQTIIVNLGKSCGGNCSTANFTMADVKSAAQQAGLIVTQAGQNYTFKISAVALECNKSYFFKNYCGYPNPQEVLLFEGSEFFCACPIITQPVLQHQGSVTIPSLNGCYRMGLYKLPEVGPAGSNCTPEFKLFYVGSGWRSAQELVYDEINNVVLNSSSPYFTFGLSNGEKYVFHVTDPISEQDLVAWANDFLTATFDEDTGDMLFVWQPEIPCGEEVFFYMCHSTDTGICLNSAYPWSKTEAACCPCLNTCTQNFEFDFSGSNCFNWVDFDEPSTNYLALFLSDSAAFPFTSKYCISRLPVPDFPEPSSYQSIIVAWLQGIPGVSVTWVPGDECQLIINYAANIPCETNYRLVLAYVDEDNNISTTAPYNASEPASCECPPAPEPDTFYGLYSLSNIINIDASDCFSTMLEYWADSNSIAEGFEYFDDWKQRVRLGINGGGKKPIIIESTYRQSNGVYKRPQNKQDLSIDLHTDFLDFETQSALVDATRHPNLVIDGQNLFVNGDIEVATIQDFTTQSSFEDLAQVKFSALIQGYQPKNSTCINC